MSRVDNALLLRDTIQKIVNDKIGKTNPGSSYATVTGFNPALGIITVRYPGDDVDIEIPAGSIYPSEPGQIVRIDGPPGARVVADVKGENLTEVKARTAQETADGKNTVNYGETPPEGTDHKAGDIWFDEGNSNMPHVWKDGNWVSIEDLRVSAIAEAQDELRQDLDTVVENGVGTKSFYKPTEPTAAESKEGDLWFDTSESGNNELHTYVNGAWVSAADARIAAIQQAQAELASELNDVVENGLGTRTHYTPTQPAVADSKEGDLWFDTSTAGKNTIHVFTGGEWVSAADARLAELKAAQTEMEGDITAAQQKADDAFQNAADADSKAVTAQAKADLANDRAQAILRASNSIVPNGDFEDNSPNIWPNTTYQTGISVVEADHARSGTHVMRVDSTSANRYPLTDWRSSGEGRIYYAEVWVYHNDTDMTQRGRVSFYANSEFKDGSTTGYTGKDLDGKYVYAYQDEMTPGVWNKVSAYLTAPEGTVNIRVAPHVIKNETPFDLDDFKVIDVTESIAALREANQAKADADTAKSAADAAQSAADAAQSAASNAQSTATEALTSANSKNTVTRSTSNPSSSYTGRVDDIWWKMSTLSSGGRVIAQYRWNGTAWLTETIDNAVIANLDAAKITTGYLDAARIQANTLNADTVLVNGSLGSTIIRDGAVTTAKIDVGAITAESGVVASLDAGKITVGEMSGARIEAGTVGTDKLIVGSAGNLIPGNPDPTIVDFPYLTYDTAEEAVRADGKSTHYTDTEFMLPAGEYRMTVDMKASVEGTRSYIGIYHPEPRWVYGIENQMLTTEWETYTGTITVTESRQAYPHVLRYLPAYTGDSTATIWFRNLRLQPVAGATLIEPGAITTEKIAVGAITAESGVVASLDAGKITVGTLDTARLAANSITADKVLIGSDRNMLPNGEVRTGDLSGWPNTLKVSTDAPDGYPFSVTNEDNLTMSADLSSHGLFPVSPGDVLVLDLWVKADKPDSRLYIETRTSGDMVANSSHRWESVEGTGPAASYLYPVANYIVPTTWTRLVQRVKVRPGVKDVYLSRVYFNHANGTERGAIQSIAGMKLYRAVGTTLIEPGAITTEKIATGAITAESGVIGSLDASKITVGKLSGARLEADAINGMQIIGATIATSTTFPRVQLDTAGIAVYKSSTVRSFFADASTGNLDLVGDLATATAGNERVVLNNALWNSIEVVDENGALAGSVAGSGVRVGAGDQSTLDLFHAGRSFAGSTGSYVDYGAIMGPRPTGQSRGAMLSLSRTVRSDNSEFNWAALDVGKANGYYTARMGVTDSDASAFINANGPVRVTSDRFFSVSTTRGLRMYVGENQDFAKNYTSGLYVETNAREPVVINKIERPGYTERTSLSLQYNGDELASLMATKGYHAHVSSQGDTLGMVLNGMVSSADGSKLTVSHDGQAELHGSDIRPLTIKYNGTGASWLIPFKKGNTEWGYVGSTGAMGTDDFGIQSGSGKRLFLSAAGSGTNVTMAPNGDMLFNVGNVSGGSRMRATPIWGVTSSTGTPVRVNSSGTLFRDGSSERYKQDIEDAPDMSSILSITPRVWREKSAVAAAEALVEYRKSVEIGPVPREFGDAAENAPWHFGAVAEELDELGLKAFVQYDEFGRPDGIEYDRIGVALIPEVRNLRDRVAALEALLDTPTETAPVD